MEKLIQKRGKTLFVHIPKEVDHCFADAVREEVDRRLQLEDIQKLEFDFTNTEFMDSSGIGVVIGRSKTMRFRSGTITVTGVGKRVDTILRSAGLYQLLQTK